MRSVDQGRGAAVCDTQKAAAESVGAFELTPRLLARNTLFNLVGQGLPLLVAVGSVPYLVHRMGPDRFGVLSLAWVILGYFTVFDLGLGRATTKHVAELLGRGEEDRVPQVLRTSLVCQLTLGLLGGLTLFVATPSLVERALRIPADLEAEARGTFAVLSAALPLVLISSSLFGALEAQQRFDLVNALKAPASAGTYLLPAVAVAFKAELPAIVALVVLWRAVGAGFLFALNRRWLYGNCGKGPTRGVLRELLGFGAWVTVSAVISPALVYFDRFLVAALVSVTAVGYYTAPYEAVTRLWIVPASAVAVLFPAFSTLSAKGAWEASATLLFRSLRVIGATLAPLVLLIVVFAREIMTAWLGSAFAHESYRALQILAVGVLLNSLAHAPYAFIQGIGRPDLTAKFHLLELPIYAAGAFLLVKEFGVVGAALAWTLRVALDTTLLIAAAVRLSRPPRTMELAARAAATAAALLGAGFGGGKAGAWLAARDGPMAWLLVVLLAVVAVVVVWRLLLEEEDRRFVLSGVERL